MRATLSRRGGLRVRSRHHQWEDHLIGRTGCFSRSLLLLPARVRFCSPERLLLRSSSAAASRNAEKLDSCPLNRDSPSTRERICVAFAAPVLPSMRQLEAFSSGDSSPRLPSTSATRRSLALRALSKPRLILIKSCSTLRSRHREAFCGLDARGTVPCIGVLPPFLWSAYSVCHSDRAWLAIPGSCSS